VSDNPHRSSTT